MAQQISDNPMKYGNWKQLSFCDRDQGFLQTNITETSIKVWPWLGN